MLHLFDFFPQIAANEVDAVRKMFNVHVVHTQKGKESCFVAAYSHNYYVTVCTKLSVLLVVKLYLLNHMQVSCMHAQISQELSLDMKNVYSPMASSYWLSLGEGAAVSNPPNCFGRKISTLV